MKRPELNQPILKSGMERARAIEQEIDAAIAILCTAADERDAANRLTKAAKDVRQALQNPSLATTTIPVSLRAMSKTRLRLLREAHDAHVALEQATAAYGTALAALRWHDLKREIYEQDIPKPRKQTLSAAEVSVEEMKFLHEMRVREVPISAMDQGNAFERDFIALFIKELAKPIDKRGPAGAWARTFNEGELTMPVSSMTEDQVEAIRLVYDPARDAGIAAKQALESVAGRELDISLNFALMLVAINEQIDVDELPGLQLNIETAKRIAWQADVAKILMQLDLSLGDVDRARAILNGPPSSEASVATPAPTASNDSSPAGSAGQAEIDRYGSIAKIIVEKKIDDLWIAIGLPLRTESLRNLEIAAQDALQRGVQIDYLKQVADQAEWKGDIGFIDEFAKIERRFMSQRLATDANFRMEMRRAGFDVPYPPD